MTEYRKRDRFALESVENGEPTWQEVVRLQYGYTESQWADTVRWLLQFGYLERTQGRLSLTDKGKETLKKLEEWSVPSEKHAK